MKKHTRKILVGDLQLGGGAPVSVQSMTKTKTADVRATIEQIHQLEEAGCQVVRCAVPDRESALALKEIKKNISIPLVADIHFNHEHALLAAEAGVDKLRINPGNIGSEDKVKAVVSAAKERKIPIRIGVNSGSLPKDVLQKNGGRVTADGIIESALRHVAILERYDFHDIVLSLKATSVPLTIEAYRLMAEKVDYPLHVGITESGIPRTGIIRSAVGIGAILAEGIGDTLRVSLTGDPVEEVRVGFEILKSLELYKLGVTVISCPTCGRTDVDVATIAGEIEARTRGIKKPLTIAVMGCEVNGPGEAAEADLGLACGKGVGLIFRSGKIVKKVAEAEMVEALMAEVNKMIGGQ
ncbi:4-hydroxy-3-methylbut-2-en-1-yl diphosphate synthase [candidate division WOR-1 bacterium RIFOXYA12_FULL_52_29]|uniref:4-hydroxy-3-methylbut-2-en-1-yl diphosphate synthase (flavodoxin) n=1 Tax=candidate division WOR-1 bacterium RIFOXYC12_FULL_54_18 TaxID=1802584 RepID=A0A1F4T8Q0_UNCSA|nr:MAG: 4-hydroxy-3-methylbut-2-en-1-yl diphosphate synthase [candidate division WOR-1 bacterium RIFOXYA2_FULL_51_19]OGC18473.1 MAG: 4-hydroxy-3-methylbut-2-en-1-yl diphosphate synthase [candidate division WOR-1 bacterium RIFOXYA12_FULL_52_29]OGC27328.1 MAG: 4-hydroxy-3-methylbut-2-en-1-yl diphosphate synthase [candidate division WOR-1 bacterium RIFOXYB2_FULL_45_9]OGC28890.1 MAG: 4-hydroxy-3-methylbut-2-en-1-yl diphosphate synthase [candidate division WOR-1 bacterium RIFOXYC12_FULL_54_18]OGC300